MTPNQRLKKLLNDQFELEGELLDLLEQCFKQMFEDNHQYMMNLLHEDIECGMHHNGCLQSLEYYKKEIRRIKAHQEEQ